MIAAGPSDPELDRFVARLLTIGTYVGVGILAIGVVVLVASGTSPLSPNATAFDPPGVVDQLMALRPEGFLWLGLVVVLATPSLRVLASLVGYIRESDGRMTLVAIGILAVIATSVVTAVATGA